MKIRIFDAHCHINLMNSPEKLQDIVLNLNIAKLAIMGTRPEDWELIKTFSLSQKTNVVHA